MSGAIGPGCGPRGSWSYPTGGRNRAKSSGGGRYPVQADLRACIRSDHQSPSAQIGDLRGMVGVLPSGLALGSLIESGPARSAAPRHDYPSSPPIPGAAADERSDQSNPMASRPGSASAPATTGPRRDRPLRRPHRRSLQARVGGADYVSVRLADGDDCATRGPEAQANGPEGPRRVAVGRFAAAAMSVPPHPASCGYGFPLSR
jgi:hypothetical protein